MALNFPSSPVLNQTYTVGNKTWVWNGTAWNLTTVLPSLTVTGNIDAAGNVSANNFIGNANASSLNSGIVPSARLSGTYSINISGIAATANTVTDNAQPNITSVGTLTSLSVSGNASAGNLATSGLITVTGNVTGGNINTAGLITATGNITTVANVSGNFVLGNAYYLTDVIINKGTSNLRIDTANGNILANVNGTANVVAVTQEGLLLGNTTVANIKTLAAPLWITPATGQYVSLNSDQYSELYWTSNLANIDPANGNDNYSWIYAGNGGVFINTEKNGNFYSWSFYDSGLASFNQNFNVDGNTTVGWLQSGSDVIANANVSAVGNVSGNFILGNGYYLSGIITSVANINNGTSNIRIETSGGNILANVGGVANVFAITTAGANVAGNLDVTSNVSASFYTGNGYYLTGIITSVSNINNGTSNIRIDSSGGNAYANIGGTANVLTIASSGLYVNGVSSTSGNVTAGNIDTAGLVTATGNITSTANVIGGNVNTAGLVSATGNVIGGNITTAGAANVGSLTVVTDALISGNLTVNGNTNYINVTNLNVQDPIIGIGRGANNTPLSSDDGKDRGEQLWYYSGSEQSAFIGYDNSAGNLIAATNVSISNEVVTVNNYGNFVVGTLSAQTISSTSNVSLTGNLNAGNIISNGIITSTGNITSNGNISGSYVIGNGSALTGIANFDTVYWQLSVQGNVTGNSLGNSVLTAANSLGVLLPRAGNGIALAGNATTNVLTVEVLGSTNDGTIWGNGGDCGLVTQAVTAYYDNGTVTDLTLTASYDLGALPQVATFNTENIVGNLIPNINATYTIGNATQQWQSLYIVGTSFLSVVSATGNVTGGNITTAGLVTATGNVTSTANVTGGNITTAGLVTATGNITGGNITTAGLVTATGNVTSTANVTGGNLITAGIITATGNITGNYILGNGACLTGVITSVANINNGNSNVTVVSSGGNVTVGVGGTSNVAVFSSGGITIGGTANLVGSTSAIGALFSGIKERVNVTGIAATGNLNIDLSTAPIWFYNANSTGNVRVNLTAGAGNNLGNLTSTGESVTYSLLMQNGATGYFANTIQVDGTTANVSTKWLGNVIPISGSTNSIDVYSFSVVKTAASTYTVLASQTRYA